jgi:hypothetical protein
MKVCDPDNYETVSYAINRRVKNVFRSEVPLYKYCEWTHEIIVRTKQTPSILQETI